MNCLRNHLPLLLSSIAALMPAVFASPAIARELSHAAAPFTVRVDVPGDGDGSGVLIAKDGYTYYVLTAWHVVNQQGTYTIYTYDSRPYEVDSSRVQRLADYDLAVVEFNSYNDYPLASINPESLIPNQSVSVSGWINPVIEITNPTYQLISGSLTGYASPPEDGGYSLIFSTVGAFRGMSGGPVMDEENKVIGIIGQGARDFTEGPIGLYLGIPISAFMDSSYAQYIQASQYANPNEQASDVLYPTQQPSPDIAAPDVLYVPDQGDPPRISD